MSVLRLVFSIIFLVSCTHPSSLPNHAKNSDNLSNDSQALSRYGNPAQYRVYGKNYQVLSSSNNFVQKGVASWYGPKFHKKRTSSGEVYNMHQLTAAHKTLPLPSYVRVTNLLNHRQIVVKINDRGPFHGDRILDLSFAAAKQLGILQKGTAPVKIESINNQENARTPGQYYLQVGAFSSKNNAESLLQRLQEVNRIYPAKIIQTNNTFLVHVGPISDFNQCALIQESLVAHGYPNTFSLLKS